MLFLYNLSLIKVIWSLSFASGSNDLWGWKFPIRGLKLHIVFQTQQIWDVGPTLVYCWANVVDGGPTVNQRWANVPIFGVNTVIFISIPGGVQMCVSSVAFPFSDVLPLVTKTSLWATKAAGVMCSSDVSFPAASSACSNLRVRGSRAADSPGDWSSAVKT